MKTKPSIKSIWISTDEDDQTLAILTVCKVTFLDFMYLSHKKQ